METAVLVLLHMPFRTNGIHPVHTCGVKATAKQGPSTDVNNLVWSALSGEARQERGALNISGISLTLSGGLAPAAQRKSAGKARSKHKEAWLLR